MENGNEFAFAPFAASDPLGERWEIYFSAALVTRSEIIRLSLSLFLAYFSIRQNHFIRGETRHWKWVANGDKQDFVLGKAIRSNR